MKRYFAFYIFTLLSLTHSSFAATTISTDITTGGTITSSGVATSSFVGALGIGTTSPGYKLSVDGDANITDMLAIGSSINTYDGWMNSNNVGIYINKTISNTENYGYGLSSTPVYDSDTSIVDNWMYGADITPQIIGSRDMGGVYGINVIPDLDDYTGSIYSVISGSFYTFNGPGRVTDMYGLDVNAAFYDPGAVTNRYGVKIGAPYGTHTSRLSNNYGLYIADQSGSGATSTYNFYSAGTNSENYFGGKVGIGTTTPTTHLQVTSPSSNATSTVTIGKTGQNKGGCIEMYDVSGTVKYISVVGTSLVVSATSCK